MYAGKPRPSNNVCNQKDVPMRLKCDDSYFDLDRNGKVTGVRSCVSLFIDAPLILVGTNTSHRCQ
jgi:hypothetical protein